MTGKTKEPVDLRADKIKQIVFSKSEGGKAPISIFDKEAVMGGTLVGESSANHGTVKSALLSDMESIGRELLSIRKGLHSEIQATSADFGQYIKSRYGFSSIDEMLRIGLGVEPSRATVMQFQTSSDFNLGYRWLIAELILAAVKQELVVPPIYKELIGKSVTISQNEIKVPVIGMVDAMPTVIGEADTIPTGSFKFGQKEATTFEVGTGISITDQTAKYVSLDIMGMYLSSVPQKIDNAFSALALQTIISGNVTGEEAPVIGVDEVTKFKYIDLLRMWARGSRLGRNMTTIICDEESYIEFMMLQEVYGFAGGTTKLALQLMSNTPTTSKIHIHGMIPTGHALLLDNKASLLELVVEEMHMESERIVSQGINATYVKQRKGFAKLWQDASVILDKATAYNKVAGQTGGFPTWMDPTPIELSMFKGRAV